MNKIMQKTLPKAPGVYLFKDKRESVIYVGKAKNIHKRVQSYFQKQKGDWKIQALLHEQDEVDYILTKNESEALLLEAQLIRDYKPKFNVLLKEGQPFVYILFGTVDEEKLAQKTKLPIIELVRNKKKKGRYFGPFLRKQQARSAHRYLVETFRLNLCNKKIENGCLDYHLGFCAGSCKKDFDTTSYLFRLQLAYDALKNNHRKLTKKIKQQIAEYNQELAFEKAMNLYQYLENLDVILQTLRTKFSESKYRHDIFTQTTPAKHLTMRDGNLAYDLQQFLKLEKPIERIDCFDISHFQSSYLVGSCVRFYNGIPDKNNFRRFKIRTLSIQNDYAALQEIVSRRYKSHLYPDATDIKSTPQLLPDLILIDGGKGQLSAVTAVITDIPCVSLAKREETLFGKQFPDGVRLNIKRPIDRLLIELRDYAHHFAISYHRTRRSANFIQK